ncbi:glutamine--fructose-6-phosphate transaminase (isomerizing) [Vermiphilus pyriformis]|uniref:Glutamine--fructose-6-phosphate aminotransferase [isomerizing] n=1 Tax=candidate division TM6 bacterium JCVI TM6SC1 TaxID=1306947 RepID=A0A0D2I392_9BACT|nr:hypothetical protein J120_01645 [candidate division TM6 bacterium JCVI TM6SC1]UNE35680.1 MAG: glutamine--fructose-6-phosphate transaminase (isomerizing) [Vermiphilus pyriformis]
MCSVVGYNGSSSSSNIILSGLSRLEYRGYDSAGFACIDNRTQQLEYAKVQGSVEKLAQAVTAGSIDGIMGIGHTRWSTHGAPIAENAHPHFDCTKTVAIVHNGIIENHYELRQELANSAHIFHSQTDSEVIAHVLEIALEQHADIHKALIQAVNRLEGAFAFLAVSEKHPEIIIAVRKRSPLCVGKGVDGMYIASDPLAFASYADQVVFMPENTFALVYKHNVEFFNFDGSECFLSFQNITFQDNATNKNGFEHFMLKEIYEQKEAIGSTVNFLEETGELIWDYIGLTPEQIKKLDRIHLIGCGTSGYAAHIGQFFFEHFAMLKADYHLASEFRYMPLFVSPNQAYIAISQSGETADTLEVIRMLNASQLHTIGLTNVPTSSLVREADGFLLTQAGPEISVASTKAFTTQLTALYWLAMHFGHVRGVVSKSTLDNTARELHIMAQLLESTLDMYKFDIIQKYAPHYAQFKKMIFLGRHVGYPLASEFALKMKELTYIFAQSYPAGELKHGPLALIDAQTPVILISSTDPLIYQKLVANAQEVKARGAHLVVLGFEGQHELAQLADLYFACPVVKPLQAPFVLAGLMQFFVYQIAYQLGCSIDKPRNLAKSVTVE